MTDKVERKQETRRREIIEAVIPLISTTPFDEIGVTDLCRAAGISVGTFYHYFSAKNDLLVGLLGLIDVHISENADRLCAQDERENLMTYAALWAEHVCGNGIARSRLISSVEPRNTDAFGSKREAVVMLEEILRRGQAKGQITADRTPETLAELFILAMRGVTVDWSRHNGSYDIAGTMAEYMRFFIRGIGA